MITTKVSKAPIFAQTECGDIHPISTPHFHKKSRQKRIIFRITASILSLFLLIVLASPSHSFANTSSDASTSLASSFSTPNDPDFAKQWAFTETTLSDKSSPRTNIDKAWVLMPPYAEKVRVAILDNGFDIDHPDLSDNINRSLAWNTHAQNHDVSVEQCEKWNGHGTHVLGIFGAVSNNGIGIAGIANNYAEIIPIKTSCVTSCGRFGVTLDETAAGIDYAVENDCKIINICNGTYSTNGVRNENLDRAIENANNHGVIVIAAAGNNNSSDMMFPSDHDLVISVTSATEDGDKTYYSDHNQYKNIAAPGGGQKSEGNLERSIYSTVPGGYGEKSGTSMAAPFVTGVVTLMLASNPNLTVDEVKHILYSTATDLGEPGRDDDFGAGLIDAEAAVREAQKLGTPLYFTAWGRPSSTRFR